MLTPVKQLLTQLLNLKPEDQKRYADEMLVLFASLEREKTTTTLPSLEQMKADFEALRKMNAHKGFTKEELQAWREDTRY